MPYDRDSRPQTQALTRPFKPLRWCPEGNAVGFSGTSWYGIPSIANFDICSHCYDTKIRGTRHQNVFSVIPKAVGEKTMCDFSTPRAVQLWERAKQSGDTSELRAYMQHRASIVSCPGAAGCTPTSSPGVEWYTPVANRHGGPDTIDGFVTCKACYEELILATPFADHFEPSFVVQGPQAMWSCDIGPVPFIWHSIKEASKDGPHAWRAVVDAIRIRTAAPPCAGLDGTHGPTTWWAPKQPIGDVVFCHACFLDQIVPLGRAGEFTHSRPQPPGELWACDWKNPRISLPYQTVCTLNLSMNIWRDAVAMLTTSKPCTAEGVLDSEWYVMTSPPGHDTDICLACFYSYIRPFGFENHYTRRTYPKGTTRTCDLHLTYARTGIYIDKIIEAAQTSDFGVLAQHAIAHSRIPLCTKSIHVSSVGRRFYGVHDCVACEECYHDIVRPSSYDQPFPLLQVTGEIRCRFWNNEARAAWTAACASKDFTAFNALVAEQETTFQRRDLAAYNQAKANLYITQYAGLAMARLF